MRIGNKKNLILSAMCQNYLLNRKYLIICLSSFNTSQESQDVCFSFISYWKSVRFSCPAKLRPCPRPWFAASVQSPSCQRSRPPTVTSAERTRSTTPSSTIHSRKLFKRLIRYFLHYLFCFLFNSTHLEILSLTILKCLLEWFENARDFGKVKSFNDKSTHFINWIAMYFTVNLKRAR